GTHPLLDRRPRVPEALQGLVQVDDVDAVALHEDESLHLRIPPPRLVPEVDSRLEQVLHRDLRHHFPPLGFSSAARAVRSSLTPAGDPGLTRERAMCVALTLAELEALPRSRPSVLLALLHARVTRQQALAAELGAQRVVVLEQRARDRHPQGARLAGE